MTKLSHFFVAILAISLAGLACAANSTRGDAICTSLADKNLPPETLAVIDGHPITFLDLERSIQGAAKGTFMKAKIKFFEAKKDALDAHLYDQLLEKVAKERKKTVAEVTEAEITGKIKKVSDKDVKAFYEKVAAQRGKMGQKLPPLDDRISQQIRQSLERGKSGERKEAFFAELRSKYKVAYLFDTPRLEVAVGSNPPLGNKKAKITVVEFSDFECPYCKKASDTFAGVFAKYPGKIRRYFRDFPLGFHKKARPAAIAARCAGEQGKYWEYHDKLFEKQELEAEHLSAHAKALKLDASKFESCMKSNKYNAEIEKDMKEASGVGVSGTPAFFINGKMISGAQPPEAFKKIIDQELARLK